MHEHGVARRLLPRSPVKRKIVKKIAEIAAGGAGGRGSKALLPQMRGEAARGEGRGDAVMAVWEHGATAGQRTRRIGPRHDPVMGKTLDAEVAGALRKTEMQTEARTQRVEEARRTERDCRPFGGQNFRVHVAEMGAWQ